MSVGRLLEQHFQLLLLSSAVQVECPSYNGNHLTEVRIHSLASLGGYLLFNDTVS